MLSAAWVQLIFLYIWLGIAIYLFYLWSKMCQSIFQSMDTVVQAGSRIVDATDQFSRQMSTFLDRATETVTRLENQFFREEINPLLDDEDEEKYKID